MTGQFQNGDSNWGGLLILLSPAKIFNEQLTDNTWHLPSFQGQLPSTDGSGCREAVISVAQAFDDVESKEEVAGLLQETDDQRGQRWWIVYKDGY